MDGKGVDAKLQHPLGVAWDAGASLLYVADSYNHKIKVVDPKSKQCRTLAGAGEASDTVGPGFDKSAFNEPGGLCVGEGGKVLYVADTNNHQIKVLDLQTKTVSVLPVVTEDVADAISSSASSAAPPPRKTPKLPKSAPVLEMPPLAVAPGQTISMELSLTLPEGTKLTEEAPSFWSLSAEGNDWLLQSQAVTGDISDLSQPVPVRAVVPVVAPATPDPGLTLTLMAWVYCCLSDGGACMMKAVAFRMPLRLDSAPRQGPVPVTLAHTFQK